MKRRLNRRDWLQLSTFGAVAVAAAPYVRPAPRRVAAQTRGPLTGATESSFSPIPAALAFGAVADVAAGWDGTLWGVDASGAPSVYDPVAGAWQLHGTGIDAIAYASAPAPLTVADPPAPLTMADWQRDTPYAVGDQVAYGGTSYQALQAHRSQIDWAPADVLALWQPLWQPLGT